MKVYFIEIRRHGGNPYRETETDYYTLAGSSLFRIAREALRKAKANNAWDKWGDTTINYLFKGDIDGVAQ